MKIISLSSKKFQEAVENAARAIKAGGVIVAPTDTVYGLLADATNQKAVDKVYQIKLRQKDKPLPIFVKNMAAAKKLALVTEKQQQFLEDKWPGKFTAALPKRTAVKIFGTNDKTVALRIPHYPFVNSLLGYLNLPLTGTSANLSGRPGATKIDDVLKQFTGAKTVPDLVINAGDLPDSKPSTIVCLACDKPRVIRE
jgi:L-threonylcarbamoyladenylate synthase